MLIEISRTSVSFGVETILSDIDFCIKNSEKIGIVGRNGCGKTTLLNLIAGKVEPDAAAGDQPVISRHGKLTVGYLQQTVFEDESITLAEEIQKAFRRILDAKARLDALLEQMESDATPDIVQEYVDLLEQLEHMGGYEYEKQYELLVRQFGFSEDDKSKTALESAADIHIFGDNGIWDGQSRRSSTASRHLLLMRSQVTKRRALRSM